MTALTDLYIDTVVRRLPEDSRGDIADEIRATINDMVEARLGGDDSDAARVEREVLEEMGDPAVLAREYSNSPQHLIGPASYPLFLWCMRRVLPIVAVVTLLINALAHSLTTPEVQLGSLLGAAIGNTVMAVLATFAVITILLALGDHGLSPNAKTIPREEAKWSVDQLQSTDPAVSQNRLEAICSLVILVILAAVPFIPTTLLYVGHLNNGETFINPDLAPGWLAGYWLLLGLIAVVESVKLIRGTTPPALLLIGGAIDVVLAVFLTVAMLTQKVIHPGLQSAAGPDLQQIIIVVAVWIIVIWDQISTWRSIRAAR